VPESTSYTSEWLTHQHRDTLASIIGHPSLIAYLAIADGEAIGRVKFEMTEVSVTVCDSFHRTLIITVSECYSPVVHLHVKTRIECNVIQ